MCVLGKTYCLAVAGRDKHGVLAPGHKLGSTAITVIVLQVNLSLVTRRSRNGIYY
jgi:hypothetical protein